MSDMANSHSMSDDKFAMAIEDAECPRRQTLLPSLRAGARMLSEFFRYNICPEGVECIYADP